MSTSSPQTATQSRRPSLHTRWAESVVGRDDGASRDLAVVQQVVGVRCILEGEVFDEHLDLPAPGQRDDLDQFGDRAPKRWRDRAFVRWAGEADRQSGVADADDGEVS